MHDDFPPVGGTPKARVGDDGWWELVLRGNHSWYTDPDLPPAYGKAMGAVFRFLWTEPVSENHAREVLEEGFSPAWLLETAATANRQAAFHAVRRCIGPAWAALMRDKPSDDLASCLAEAGNHHSWVTSNPTLIGLALQKKNLSWILSAALDDGWDPVSPLATQPSNPNRWHVPVRAQWTPLAAARAAANPEALSCLWEDLRVRGDADSRDEAVWWATLTLQEQTFRPIRPPESQRLAEWAERCLAAGANPNRSWSVSRYGTQHATEAHSLWEDTPGRRWADAVIHQEPSPASATLWRALADRLTPELWPMPPEDELENAINRVDSPERWTDTPERRQALSVLARTARPTTPQMMVGRILMHLLDHGHEGLTEERIQRIEPRPSSLLLQWGLNLSTPSNAAWPLDWAARETGTCLSWETAVGAVHAALKRPDGKASEPSAAGRHPSVPPLVQWADFMNDEEAPLWREFMEKLKQVSGGKPLPELPAPEQEAIRVALSVARVPASPARKLRL